MPGSNNVRRRRKPFLLRYRPYELRSKKGCPFGQVTIRSSKFAKFLKSTSQYQSEFSANFYRVYRFSDCWTVFKLCSTGSWEFQSIRDLVHFLLSKDSSVLVEILDREIGRWMHLLTVNLWLRSFKRNDLSYYLKCRRYCRVLSDDRQFFFQVDQTKANGIGNVYVFRSLNFDFKG